MDRLIVCLALFGLFVSPADAGLFGRRSCSQCQSQRVAVYQPRTVQPAAYAVSQGTQRIAPCPDVHRQSGCPDGNCFPRHPQPQQPPTTPPPFDFPPDDEGDNPPVPVPPLPPTPVNPLDRAQAIIAILSAVAGILAGFGVVKAEDDPDSDPENDGLIKSIVAKVKEAV